MRRRDNFSAMAWMPSHRAPAARDVLRPPPFTPPQAPFLSADEQGLLSAVIAAKDADAPRRRYAEWLIARRNPRGPFILDQLAGRAVKPDPAWERIFEPWSARDLEWRRGFVEGMSLSGRAFISLGAPLFSMTPLRRVRLVAVAPYLDELAACPHLALLGELDLRGNHIDDPRFARSTRAA